MKIGANLVDQKRIAYYYDVGGTPEQISQKLKIELKVVRSFEPKKVKETKNKTKAKNKKSEQQHKEIMDSKTAPDIMPDAPRPESE